jgi:hypothetical protein
MIEENEGADHAPFRLGQDAADLESTQAAPALFDDKFDHAASLGLNPGNRIPC